MNVDKELEQVRTAITALQKVEQQLMNQRRSMPTDMPANTMLEERFLKEGGDSHWGPTELTKVVKAAIPYHYENHSGQTQHGQVSVQGSLDELPQLLVTLVDEFRDTVNAYGDDLVIDEITIKTITERRLVSSSDEEASDIGLRVLSWCQLVLTSRKNPWNHPHVDGDFVGDGVHRRPVAPESDGPSTTKPDEDNSEEK